MPALLSPADEKFRDDHNVKNWTTTKDFKERQKDLYFESLDSFAERLTVHGDDEVAFGRSLVELLKIVISKDPSFKAYWMGSRGEEIRKEDTWPRLYACAAAVVVERWLRERKPDLGGQAIITIGEVRDEVDVLITLAVERGELAYDDAKRARVELGHIVDEPDLTEQIRVGLTTFLADEVDVAGELDGDDLIPKGTREREIGKRALMRLSVSKLKELARERDLPVGGKLEDIAARLVRLVQADHEAIAQMVIDAERGTPPPERGLTTRLVGLQRPPDLDRVAERLGQFERHLLRVGVARWFVLRRVRRERTTFTIDGTSHFYDAVPQFEDDEYSISAREREAEVRVKLHDDVSWIEVAIKRGRSVAGLERALERATSIEVQRTLPMAVRAPEGEMFGWSRNTVFMLDFLESRLADDDLACGVVRVVQFDEDEKAPDDNRPRVRSVRLEGEHIPSSQQACALIVAGRRVRAVALSVIHTPNRDEQFVLPVRIELHDDHAIVWTGLERHVPDTVVAHVQRLLVGRLRKALNDGLADAAALTTMVAKIKDRAEDPADPESADIAAPKRAIDVADEDAEPDAGTAAA